MTRLSFTILGCGSSGGVPRLGGNWGACDPGNPKNHRRRCSMLIERHGGRGTTRVLIDTSPDMRAQLLDAGVGTLDGVIYTHSHADHMHGIDDLRMVVFNNKKRLSVWADGPTQEALLSRFGYAIVQPGGSPYPPILNLHTIGETVAINGPGGTIDIRPFPVVHGTMDALGFRVGNLAYLPDVSDIPTASRAALRDLDCWVVDALRRDPHPTHFHLSRTLEWIDKIAPRRAVLTNLHNDLDYAALQKETPKHIEPAFDGMQIEYEL